MANNSVSDVQVEHPKHTIIRCADRIDDELFYKLGAAASGVTGTARMLYAYIHGDIENLERHDAKTLATSMIALGQSIQALVEEVERESTNILEVAQKLPDAPTPQARPRRSTLDPDQIHQELACTSEGIQAIGVVLGSAQGNFSGEVEEMLGHAVWVLGKHAQGLTAQLELQGAFSGGEGV